MFWFIVSLVVTIVLFGFLTYVSNGFKLRCFAALLGLLIMPLSFFASIPTGFTGVLVTFGKVEDTTLEAGLRFKKPWQEIVLIDNREQKSEFTLSAFSSDIQQVDMKGSINYNVDRATAMDLYRSVGVNYNAILIQPRLSENVKGVFSKYTAENLVANRETLSREIGDLMKNELEPYGINIISVAVEDIEFTDSFTNAVEAKQVAAQNKLTAQTQQEQKTMEAEAEAKRKKIEAESQAAISRINAEADLEVQKINADAAEYAGQKEAAINKAISESITPVLIQYQYALRWNGVLPQVALGDNTVPVIDVMKENVLD